MRPRSLRTLTAAVGVIACLTLLAGCSSDPIVDAYKAGTNKGYISGDGAIETFEGDSIGDPVRFSGTTESGDTFDSTEALGSVLVVNFWYASCPPCRAEAKDLEALSQEFAADGVQFVGVNVRDEAGTARSFASTFGVTYPSILDNATADVQLAFSNSIQPNAVPTTLVLDTEGRVVARILGQVTEPSLLETIIRDTVDASS